MALEMRGGNGTCVTLAPATGIARPGRRATTGRQGSRLPMLHASSGSVRGNEQNALPRFVGHPTAPHTTAYSYILSANSLQR